MWYDALICKVSILSSLSVYPLKVEQCVCYRKELFICLLDYTYVLHQNINFNLSIIVLQKNLRYILF